MRVFASKYLESPSRDELEEVIWTWTPANREATEIYASGAPTNTKQSTYAAERDNRSDNDRPNEGTRAFLL
jgi:hypothetical protein